MKNTIKRAQPKPAPSTVTQCSGCSFRLNVSQGMLTAYSPVRVSMTEITWVNLFERFHNFSVFIKYTIIHCRTQQIV